LNDNLIFLPVNNAGDPRSLLTVYTLLDAERLYYIYVIYGKIRVEGLNAFRQFRCLYSLCIVGVTGP